MKSTVPPRTSGPSPPGVNHDPVRISPRHSGGRPDRIAWDPFSGRGAAASITFHRQLLRHDPASGIIGDCYRTAIACRLNMDPADVPHFMQGRAGPPGMRDANTWLAERGYSLVRQRHPGGIEDLLGIMRRIACDNTGSYYL